MLNFRVADAWELQAFVGKRALTGLHPNTTASCSLRLREVRLRCEVTRWFFCAGSAPGAFHRVPFSRERIEDISLFAWRRIEGQAGVFFLGLLYGQIIEEQGRCDHGRGGASCGNPPDPKNPPKL